MARPWIRILGVDTSLRSSGVGVLETNGQDQKSLYCGTIKNRPRVPRSACLQHIHVSIQNLIEEYHPDAAAIEGIFHCKNIKTAFILGEARGTVISACALASLPVYEYAPRLVKKAVAGVGSAHKDQVGKMIQVILGLEVPPSPDAADALAIALCHAHGLRSHSAIPHEPL